MKVEQLDLKDREEFGRIVNVLLAENCIYQYSKIQKFEKKERNADYSFINDHWDCFEEYLPICRMAAYERTFFLYGDDLYPQ